MTITNQQLQGRRESAVPQGVACLLPTFMARAQGAEIWDVEGRRLIDFASGIAVLNVGHGHAAVRSAVARQLERYSHCCFQVTPYEPYVALAERLNALVPTGQPNKTMLLTTGAEAVENAIKIARFATGRPAVISFVGAFHGRTALGMALTGKVQPYKNGFGPLPSEIHHVPFPNAYHGISVEHSLGALESLFKATVDPRRVAAIIVEPVQGEGGFNVAPADFLRALRGICDTHGILLIVDEIQTGFGRTGALFAVEHSGVTPDLMTMAKSLAGGMPLSAVTGVARIMDAVPPGGLGGTYAGNPLACAAALAVLDVIEQERLVEKARSIGERMRAFLESLARRDEFECIGDVRGLGAMVAVELVKNRETREPATDLAKAVVQEAGRRGLVVLTCGMNGNAIRFLVPLTASFESLNEGLELFEQSLTHAAASAQVRQ